MIRGRTRQMFSMRVRERRSACSPRTSLDDVQRRAAPIEVSALLLAHFRIPIALAAATRTRNDSTCRKESLE